MKTKYILIFTDSKQLDNFNKKNNPPAEDTFTEIGWNKRLLNDLRGIEDSVWDEIILCDLEKDKKYLFSKI